ncbi:hypothetical protein [Kineococcus rubinsiae]|uniref:hypothetical protein n=1 Tax=Kineococcus rubinsiae TaxID=2609562 RepID=UPI0014307773|nr:hypothetical protein [Kineococcus rubinsiae]NIZ91556.1 hypothetical protein [Kineococcus rubinsiae]
MSDVREPWEAELESLDPTLHDAPPALGSTRSHAILEAAMHDTTTPTTTPARPADRRQLRRHRRGTWAAVLVGAAAAGAVAVAVLPGTGPGPTPAVVAVPAAPQQLSDIVLTAAQRTAGVTSLRAALTATGEGYRDEATGEFAGADSVVRETVPGGGTLTTTVVGGTIYTTGADGRTTAEPERPADTMAPFAEAAGALVGAAVDGGRAQEVGTEVVRGASAVHYRVTLDDASRSALAALGASRLAWFDLEEPQLATAVDVWVGDGLVRRIDVAASGTTTRTEFFDLGADVTVTAPALD